MLVLSFDSILQAPPWIIGAEKDMIVQATVGKSITLICPIIGTPKPTLQWFKNDQPLQSFDIDEQYVLTDIQTSDAGIYRCVAMNRAGRAQRFFNLSVHSKNRYFIDCY